MDIGGHLPFSATYKHNFMILHILSSFYTYHFIVCILHFLPQHQFNELIVFHYINIPLIEHPIPNPVF